jgi:hypothetical protein
MPVVAGTNSSLRERRLNRTQGQGVVGHFRIKCSTIRYGPLVEQTRSKLRVEVICSTSTVKPPCFRFVSDIEVAGVIYLRRKIRQDSAFSCGSFKSWAAALATSRFALSPGDSNRLSVDQYR